MIFINIYFEEKNHLFISRGPMIIDYKDCFSKDVVYGRFCRPTLQLLLKDQCWAFSNKSLKLISDSINRCRCCW